MNLTVSSNGLCYLSHKFYFFDCSSTFSSVYSDLQLEKIKIFLPRMSSSLTKKEVPRGIFELFWRDY